MEYELVICETKLENLDQIINAVRDGITSLCIRDVRMSKSTFDKLIDVIIDSKIIKLGMTFIRVLGDDVQESSYYYTGITRILQHIRIINLSITNDVSTISLEHLMTEIVHSGVQKLKVTHRLFDNEHGILLNSRHLTSFECIQKQQNLETTYIMELAEKNHARIDIIREKCLAILYCKSLRKNVYNICAHKDLLCLVAKYVWSTRYVTKTSFFIKN